MTIPILLLLSLAPTPAVADEAQTPTADETPDARTQAEALHAEGRYAEAAEAYARAYQDTGLPELLYSRAQVERLAGDCEAAIRSYEDFLIASGDEAPPNASEGFRQVWPKMRINARRQIDACREVLDEQAAQTGPVVEAPRPTPPPVVAPPTATAPDPKTDPKIDPKTDPKTDRAGPRWTRDALGWSLVGTGLAVVATGGTLWGVAVSRDHDADGAASHDAFLAEIDRAATLQQAGFGLLAGGGALLLGGAIRLAIVAARDHGRRERRAARWIAPTRGTRVLSSQPRGR